MIREPYSGTSERKKTNCNPRSVARRGDIPAKVKRQAGKVDDAVIAQALAILKSRLQDRDELLSSPQAVRDYLRLQIANKEHEVFVCLYLDVQNRLIACEELFRGTLAQTSVYPREVVKAVLKHNAAAVIFAHNHPSGVAEPSRADEVLTSTLKQALAMVECKVLDHIVVAGTVSLSMAERGLV